MAFAKIPQGRDYLVMVVTTGLMGNLKLGGVTYNGAMPAQSGLSETEVAEVLSGRVIPIGAFVGGLTISGLATLGVIVAVWIFAL